MKKLLIVYVLAIVSTFVFGEEKCLTESWKAYNNRNWKFAVQNAEDCIFTFEAQGKEIQKQLETKGYILPQNFNVSKKLTAEQKEEIFSHGLLNDVCVSYWICGMSYLRLNDKTKAIDYFRKAESLTFGLCFNSDTNLFWSPSRDATLQLRNINKS